MTGKEVTKWNVYSLLGGNVGWKEATKQTELAAKRLAKKLERSGKTVWIKRIKEQTVYHTPNTGNK